MLECSLKTQTLFNPLPPSNECNFFHALYLQFRLQHQTMSIIMNWSWWIVLQAPMNGRGGKSLETGHYKALAWRTDCCAFKWAFHSPFSSHKQRRMEPRLSSQLKWQCWRVWEQWRETHTARSHMQLLFSTRIFKFISSWVERMLKLRNAMKQFPVRCPADVIIFIWKFSKEFICILNWSLMRHNGYWLLFSYAKT